MHDAAQADTIERVLPDKHPIEHDGCTQPRGDNRGDGGTGSTHAQGVDEDGIEATVEYQAQGGGIHGTPCVAFGTHQARTTAHQGDAHQAQKERHGIVDGCLARGSAHFEIAQIRIEDGQQEHGEEEGTHHKDDKGMLGSPLGHCLVLAAMTAHRTGGTMSQAIGDGRDDHPQGGGQADTRDGRFAQPRNPDAIDHVVERRDDHRHHDGQRQSRNGLARVGIEQGYILVATTRHMLLHF